MTRTFHDSYGVDIQDIANLERLAASNTGPEEYRTSLKELGRSLGKFVHSQIGKNDSTGYLACTVEDADNLAAGILESFSDSANLKFACFWNERFTEAGGTKAAPILREYVEPCEKSVDFLIIAKSIISGTCVVRTNLTRLMQTINPGKVFVLAPVMFEDADRKLSEAFESKISSKFHFIYLAKDSERDEKTGNVQPGVGGNVYIRLGYKGQDDKNRVTPELVKTRRSQYLSHSGRP